MKNTHFLLALVSAACLTFTGCKKSNDESPAPATTIKDFFAKTEVKSQTFTINTNNNQSSITGDQGTKVTFPKNAFTTSDGTPVTGTVSIELKEIYDKSDMVLSDRPTMSDGKLLISGGEIFIRATANGQELQLETNTNILIELAQTTDVDTTMGLFTGSVDDSSFNWTPIDIDTTAARNDSLWYVSDPGFYYDPTHYVFTIATLGWINCDRFNPQETTYMHVTCNGAPTPSATKVYLIFKNLNSVAQLNYEWGANKFYSVMAPIGEEVTVVAFGIKDGNEYFAKKDITITNDLNISMDLTQSSSEEITAALKGLN
jgi:hypothetical protein